MFDWVLIITIVIVSIDFTRGRTEVTGKTSVTLIKLVLHSAFESQGERRHFARIPHLED